MNPQPDRLEKVIHQALRDLPPRKAPAGLEQRVAAEIARRAALPWWHRSWSYWPAAIRWSFLIFAAALCAAMLLGGIGFWRGEGASVFQRIMAGPTAFVSGIWIALHVIGNATKEIVSLIPSPWLYGTLGGIALLYATLLALGATAYRTLWQTR